MQDEAELSQAASQLIKAPKVYYFTKFLEDTKLGKYEPLGILCMEWVNGDTINSLLGTGIWKIESRLDICREMVKMVQTIHNHGITHGDLYPSNWRLSYEDELYLIDFCGGEFVAPEKAKTDEIDLDTLKITLTCLIYDTNNWDFASKMILERRSRFWRAKSVERLASLI